MKRVTELIQIQEVVQAQYRLTQQDFAKIIDEEIRLRAALSHIKDTELSSQTPSEQTLQMRLIGADLSWQAWVGQTRSRLNTQLARVLAQKEPQLVMVRKAYGKVLTVSNLLERAERQQKRAQKNTNIMRTLADLR